MNRIRSGSRIARRVKTKQKGLTARRRTAMAGAREVVAVLFFVGKDLSAAEQKVGRDEDESEDGYGEGTGGGEGYSGEVERGGLRGKARRGERRQG